MFNSKQLSEKFAKHFDPKEVKETKLFNALKVKFSDDNLKQLSIVLDTKITQKDIKAVKRWIENNYNRYIWDPSYNFKYGVKNLWKWRKVIWKDRDWGYDGLFAVMEAKIDMFRKKFNENQYVVDVVFMNRDLLIVIKLLQRIREDWYGMEYTKYHDSNMIFHPIEGSEDSTLEFEEIWEKYDEFLAKYPRSVKAVLKEQKWNNLDEKKVLSMAVSQYNHDKAKKLLFKIMEEKCETWWD